MKLAKNDTTGPLTDDRTRELASRYQERRVREESDRISFRTDPVMRARVAKLFRELGISI